MALRFRKTFSDALTGANGFDTVTTTNATVAQSAGAGLNGTSGGVTVTATAASPHGYGTIVSDFAGKTTLRTAFYVDISSLAIGTNNEDVRLYSHESLASAVASMVQVRRISDVLNIQHYIVNDSGGFIANSIPLVGFPDWMELYVTRSSGVGVGDAESYLYVGGGDYEPLGELISTHTGIIHYSRFEQQYHLLGMRLGDASVSGSVIVDEWTMRDDSNPILFGVSTNTSPFLTYLRRRRRD